VGRVCPRRWVDHGSVPDLEVIAVLWLVLGVVLLIIAIAGGAIVHPILFVLAILALIMFVTGTRGRGSAA
jgi:4-amino-4-deoxy-L-arabinose transferase-like glycosyltransferase